MLSLAAGVLIVFVTIATLASQVIEVGPLAYTGSVFKPLTIEVGSLAYTGGVFELQTVDVGPLAYTGNVFVPQMIDVGPLAYTGNVFEPQTVSVGPLAYTGSAALNPATLRAGMANSANEPVRIRAATIRMTGDNASPRITPARVERPVDNTTRAGGASETPTRAAQPSPRAPARR